MGTIGSLAPAVFPALQRELPDHEIAHATAHGFQLVNAVADGSLDAAVLGVGAAEAPASGVPSYGVGTRPDRPGGEWRRCPVRDAARWQV